MNRNKRKRQTLQDRFLSTCGWCGKAILKSTPVFGAGARVRSGIDLSSKEGQILELVLMLSKKTVLAAVTTSDSAAKAEGKDLMFMACSERCASDLKRACEQEIDLGNQLGLASD